MAYLQAFEQANRLIASIIFLAPSQQQHIYTALGQLAQTHNLKAEQDDAPADNRLVADCRQEISANPYREICAFFNIPPIGALLPSDTALTANNRRYHYPKNTARPRVNAYPNQSWLTPKELLDSGYPSPLSQLLKALAQDGHDVEGCALEWKAIRYALESLFYNTTTTRKNCEEYLRRGLQVVWP